ncbi:polyprenyl synthetase family protein [Desulfitobacterium sp.]|uniref:polyprenyl synthetase family protein n=1 Tax=Desulfitobacterium sp. TaxID=49981 RepID=UPI002B66D492|nr:polyprenyl synthetase family protein [Desulfitobacterium sp.]HVJ48361.1 polyprenyl synthetase family protein [Desulfitobacterium sp.]
MEEDWDVIGHVMLQLVDDYFPVKELKNYLSEFVTFKMKGHFPFGQLAILHYQMFEGRSQDIFQAAAAVELMILSLDIFDDLQDQDDFSVPWNKIDQAISMNIATGFLVLSTKALEQTSFEQNRKVRANDYLNTLVLKAINGQHTDLRDLIESEEDYIQMVREKSGSLMAAACLVGTALASEKYHDRVNKYAEHIGIIAQIKNDIKDICRWDEKNDLINKKKTLLTLYLLKNQQPQYQFTRDYFSGKLKKEELIKNKAEIQALIGKSGALEYARVIMRLNQLQALELIDSMGMAQEWKEKLLHYV